MSSCRSNAQEPQSSHFPRVPLNRCPDGAYLGLFACIRRRANNSSLLQRSLLHSLHLLLELLHLPKTTGVAVTAVISKPALLFHLVYCCSTITQDPDSCRPSCNTAALPSLNPHFESTPVPGRPQDDRRLKLLAPQLFFPYSHARRLFPHRRHKHPRAARHTTQIAFTFTFIYPTSAPTNRWRRTSFIPSHLGRRHSQRDTATNTRP